MKTFKCKLTVVTPLFINGGDFAEHWQVEYFFKDGRAYLISLEKLLTAYLKYTHKSIREGIEFFKRLLKTENGKVNETLYNQLYTDNFKEYILSNHYYDYSVDLSNEQTLRKQRLSIKGFIKTKGEPFVPGSSIKGAIRTAVLNKIINANEIYNIYYNSHGYKENELNKFLNKKLNERVGTAEIDKFSKIAISDFMGASNKDLIIRSVAGKVKKSSVFAAEFLKPGTELRGMISFDENYFSKEKLIGVSNDFSQRYIELVNHHFKKNFNYNINNNSMFLFLGAINGWFAKTVNKIYEDRRFVHLVRGLGLGNKRNKPESFPVSLGLVNGNLVGLVKIDYEEDIDL